MSKLLRITIVLTVFTVLLCAGHRDAGAVPIVLNDARGLDLYTLELPDPLASYRFSFSYWTESKISSDGAGNPDTFYYAFNNSIGVLFDNSSDVGIANGITLPSILVTQIVSPTSSDFFKPYFLVEDGNELFDSTVYIDYELVKLESAPVPEPSTILLLGLGVVVGLGFVRRSNKSSKPGLT